MTPNIISRDFFKPLQDQWESHDNDDDEEDYASRFAETDRLSVFMKSPSSTFANPPESRYIIHPGRHNYFSHGDLIIANAANKIPRPTLPQNFKLRPIPAKSHRTLQSSTPPQESNIAIALALRQYSDAIHNYSSNMIHHYLDQEANFLISLQQQRPHDEVRPTRKFFNGRIIDHKFKKYKPPTRAELVSHTCLPSNIPFYVLHLHSHDRETSFADRMLQQTRQLWAKGCRPDKGKWIDRARCVKPLEEMNLNFRAYFDCDWKWKRPSEE
ncbi:hypothetical protein MMC12_001283 [Toensbergia leucococca]|nr:hypothetical protein [Toensbergia leucococca]